MASIFTRIVNGELPCYKIAEDNRYLSFLDIRPLTKGHTLVIPKTEVDFIFDVDDDTLAGMMVFAKRVARAIKTSVTCKRVGVLVLGDEVPHAHIHLVPYMSPTEVNIRNKPLEFSPDEMKALAAEISAAFE